MSLSFGQVTRLLIVKTSSRCWIGTENEHRINLTCEMDIYFSSRGKCVSRLTENKIKRSRGNIFSLQACGFLAMRVFIAPGILLIRICLHYISPFNQSTPSCPSQSPPWPAKDSSQNVSRSHSNPPSTTPNIYRNDRSSIRSLCAHTYPSRPMARSPAYTSQQDVLSLDAPSAFPSHQSGMAWNGISGNTGSCKMMCIHQEDR